MAVVVLALPLIDKADLLRPEQYYPSIPSPHMPSPSVSVPSRRQLDRLPSNAAEAIVDAWFFGPNARSLDMDALSRILRLAGGHNVQLRDLPSDWFDNGSMYHLALADMPEATHHPDEATGRVISSVPERPSRQGAKVRRIWIQQAAIYIVGVVSEAAMQVSRTSRMAQSE